MTIRCALLVVSTETDPVAEETVDDLRLLLGREVPALFLVEERRCGSDRHLIGEVLRGWCDEEEMDLIVTLGGTFPAPGHSGEQITPEATRDVIEREMPSLPEAMRADAVEEEAEALLDRSVAGIRARTLLVNLPGQTRLARLFAEAIVDLIPAILARLRAPESSDLSPTGAPVAPQPQERPRGTGLDADEFAAFLAARREAEKQVR